MNNLVLQKLLHSHVLFYNKNEKWRNTFIQPSHLKEGGDIKMPAEVMHSFLKDHARRIQQSMKFYIPQADEQNKLKSDELEKLRLGVDMYLPFKSTFIQHEHMMNFKYESSGKDYDKTCISNVYLEDCDFEDDENSKIYKGNVSLYMQDEKGFYFDPNDYYFSYRKDGSYTFWLGETEFSKMTDLATDTTGQYSNPTLNSMVSCIVQTHYYLVLLLSYPQIVNSQTMLGITPKNALQVPFSRNFTTSEFIRKPKYEHKVLKLNLFDTNKTNKNLNSIDGSSRAFHAVRKHIRQYADGKITFVKAHFRGSKDIGLITKDYEIINRRK